jgi:hypothetical protein
METRAMSDPTSVLEGPGAENRRPVLEIRHHD